MCFLYNWLNPYAEKNSAFGVLLEAEALQHSYDIVSTS